MDTYTSTGYFGGCEVLYRWKHDHTYILIQYSIIPVKLSVAPNSSGNLSSVTHPNKAFGHVTRALRRLERTMSVLCH